MFVAPGHQDGSRADHACRAHHARDGGSVAGDAHGLRLVIIAIIVIILIFRIIILIVSDSNTYNNNSNNNSN